MGFFRSNDDSIDAINQGFNQLQQYMLPYTQNAGTDFNNARNYIYKGFSDRAQEPDYNQQFLDLLLGNGGPNQLLNRAESGYANSDEAKNAAMESNLATSAVFNKANAAGMGGSGTEAAINAQVQNGILSENEGNYLKHLHSVLNVQEDELNNFNQGTQNLINMFKGLINDEFRASNTVGQGAMREGQMEANSYDRNNQRREGPMNNLLSLAGIAAAL